MYTLPSLKYGYAELEPYISEEQLRIYHDKHHQVYVTNVNSILQIMDKA
jgi:superoxide dismutase, Fe-Mn family